MEGANLTKILVFEGNAVSTALFLFYHWHLYIVSLKVHFHF